MNEDPNVNTGPTYTTWTVEMTQALEVAYQAALEAEEESFEFEGKTYVVSYAKYLIQYLSGEFARRGLWPHAGTIQ